MAQKFLILVNTGIFYEFSKWRKIEIQKPITEQQKLPKRNGSSVVRDVDLLTSRALRARSCTLPRSAIVGARASERVARASESSTCFPCWKSNQVTLFWRELFRVRSCLKGLKLSKLLFACLIMGSKPRLFCADQPRLFPSCFTNSRKYMYLLILNVMGL